MLILNQRCPRAIRICMQGLDDSVPLTLHKASSRAGVLQWLVRRITLSRLLNGISRASVHKIVLHYWDCIGEARCKRDLAPILATDGQRASGDHTYHAVSNLTAFDDEGKPHVLKASLISVLGQGLVLGFKASTIAKYAYKCRPPVCVKILDYARCLACVPNICKYDASNCLPCSIVLSTACDCITCCVIFSTLQNVDFSMTHDLHISIFTHDVPCIDDHFRWCQMTPLSMSLSSWRRFGLRRSAIIYLHSTLLIMWARIATQSQMRSETFAVPEKLYTICPPRPSLWSCKIFGMPGNVSAGN